MVMVPLMTLPGKERGVTSAAVIRGPTSNGGSERGVGVRFSGEELAKKFGCC